MTTGDTCYICTVTPPASGNCYVTLGSATNVTYTWPSFSNYDTATVNWDFQQLYNIEYNRLYTNFMNAYGTGNIVTNWYQNYVVSETEEQRAARIVREQQQMEAKKAAMGRAEELLLACLTDEQRESYLKDGYIDTNVKDKTYRIEKGFAGNVYLVEKQVKKARFCIHPTDFRLPQQDAMLAQLLLLNTDEDQFLKTANRTILF